MSAAAQFAHQHLAETPRGWKVRSKRAGSHVLRIAFPPGRRRRGSGKLLEVLHPKKNAACEEGSCDVREKAANNPAELLIFGNPSKGVGNHKPGCKCTFCERQRDIAKRDARMPKAMRGVMSRNPRWVHTPGRSETYRVVEVQGGPRSRRYLLEGPYPSVARVWTRTGRVYDAPDPTKQNPKGKRRSFRGKKFRGVHRKHIKKNPSETEQAVRLFETFHGKDASSIVEKHVSAALRKDYTALGNLIYVKVRTPIGQVIKLEFEDDGVRLASSPDGKQLYCIGGRQNLLPLLDEDSKQKDFLNIGECQEVAYLARKIHSDYEPVEWFHKFGEERDGSTKPQLMFDKLKKQIFFVGGEYSIDTNVDLSPGIEN
jgi:hypothetical protein